MIPALACVGVLGLAAGTWLGLAVAGVLGSEKCERLTRALARQNRELADAHAERALWQHRALVAEDWLPDLIRDELVAEEVGP